MSIIHNFPEISPCCAANPYCGGGGWAAPEAGPKPFEPFEYVGLMPGYGGGLSCI